MPLLATVLASKPLFVAKLVPLLLNQQTALSDARRELTAVGATTTYMTSDVIRSPLVVERGRMRLGVLERESGEPYREAVKILASGRYIVAESTDFSRWIYRRAKLGRAGFLLEGPTLRKPKADEPSLPPSPPTAMPYPRALWPVAYRQDHDLGKTINVSWWRLPNGVRVGSGTFYSHSRVTGEASREPIRVSFVQGRDGRTAPIESVVRIPAGVKIGAILWVSPKGWIVVEADSAREKERGLVWLYPAKS